MRPYGPAPLILGLALTVGAGRLLELRPLKRLFVRDDLARVMEQTARVVTAPDADVLLMGDSRMWADVDEALLSSLLKRECRNLGFAGATPSQCRAWLERWLATHRPPERLVLALSPVNLSRRFPGRERAGKYLDLLPRGPMDADGLGYFLLPAFRYRTELKDALKGAPPVDLDPPERRAEKAFLAPELVGLRDYTESWLPVYEEDEGEVRALREIRELCHERKIRLAVVRLPVGPALLRHERDVSRGRFETTAAVDLDLSDPSGRAFSDCNHLAPEARDGFTRRLALELFELSLRP